MNLLAQAAAGTERTSLWVWAVVGGLLVAGALVFYIARQMFVALPEDVRTSLTQTARKHVRPLAVSGVALAWSLVFVLYLISAVPAPLSAQNVTGDSNAPSSSEVLPSANAPSINGKPGAPAVTNGGSVAGSSRASQPQTAPDVFKGSSGTGPAKVAPVHLYSGPQDRIGMTDTSVKICGHASLVFGRLLNARPQDLDVYWRYLNDKGGIFGRKFVVTLEDDRYDTAAAVEAAQRCKEKNPFILIGGVGSDLIPAVRQFAERSKLLYLYSFAARKGSEGFRYSYTATTGQETISRIMGEMAVRKHPDKKNNIGIVWRNSSNLQPGREAYRAAVAKAGGKIVADVTVEKNQGNYTQEILELQQRGAEVVFVLDDAVSQLNVVKQGRSQQYKPVWQLFTFNIQAQTLKDDALDPPIEGALLWPAYTNGDYTSATFPTYAREIKEFEAAYAKYDPEADLSGPAGDLLWDVWVGFKALAGLFQACGRDCGRNKIAGVMQAGWKARIGAACPIDFSVDDHHHGGHLVDIFEAYRGPNGQAAFHTTKRCVSGYR